MIEVTSIDVDAVCERCGRAERLRRALDPAGESPEAAVQAVQDVLIKNGWEFHRSALCCPGCKDKPQVH